ncbi:MAG: hypothetical protein R3B72_45060 [Polyangiaceae bacterium]
MVWAKQFGLEADVSVWDLAVTAHGDVAFTGAFWDQVGFGGAELVPDTFGDIGSFFLARLDAQGDHVFSTMFDGDSQGVGVVALNDSQDNLLLAGIAVGAEGQFRPDFGGGPLDNPALYGAYATKLDPTSSHLWSRVDGEAGASVNVTAAALRPDDGVVIAGCFEGTLDFGDNPMESTPANDDCGDVFLVELDAEGNHLWSRHYGDAGQKFIEGVAVDGEGNVFFAVSLGGTLDVGESRTAEGTRDLLLVKLDPNGDLVWSKRYGNSETRITGIRVAMAPNGDLLVAATDHGAGIDFGSGPLPATLEHGDVPFVVRHDTDGMLLWATGGGEDWNHAAVSGGVFAVHPSGDIYAGHVVLDENGAEKYRRESCFRPTALDFDGDDVIYAGVFAGALELGDPPLATSGLGDVDVVVTRMKR